MARSLNQGLPTQVVSRTRWTLPLLLILVVTGACRTGRNYPDLSGPSYGAPLPAETRASTDTLRIASFNIEFARNIEGAIALLRSDSALRAADVLLLQEMDADGARRVAEAFGMAYVYYPAIHHSREKRDFGNAVLSRWPIVEHAKLILPHPSRYAGTQRIATAATLEIGSRKVRVYSTHLGTPADVRGVRREEQLHAIMADAARYERVIIGGDMNDGDMGPVAVAAGYTWPTQGGPRTTMLGRWDHVFLRGFENSGAGTGPDARGISDHRPVWAIAVMP
jgi:endonuclease/exonuclease/phosphatase family metal-dependent hydrolase